MAAAMESDTLSIALPASKRNHLAMGEVAGSVAGDKSAEDMGT
jgi:hypothetical protein